MQDVCLMARMWTQGGWEAVCMAGFGQVTCTDMGSLRVNGERSDGQGNGTDERDQRLWLQRPRVGLGA